MSIAAATQTLRIEQQSLLKQAEKIGKAIELLQNGSEVQQIELPQPKRGGKRKLSPQGLENIRKGVLKRLAGKKKAPTSGKGS